MNPSDSAILIYRGNQMNMIKTTMMALTKNTLLSTISAQITYTRGALIALFAGLFILAACGGGGAATVAGDGGTTGGDACATNIFDPACGVERQAERTEAINTCIDAIKAGDACEVPTAVLNCLNEPFTTEGCSDSTSPVTVFLSPLNPCKQSGQPIAVLVRRAERLVILRLSAFVAQ